MSRRKFRGYEVYFTCPYCSKDWSGERRVQRQGLSRQAKPLSEQDETIQRAYTAASEARDQHIAEKHGPETIAVRLTEIEREAKWAQDYAEREGMELNWATDPLAVEYRALMRQWWALPPQKEKVHRLGPSYNRLLTSKGRFPQTPGERAMVKIDSELRKMRAAKAA